MIASENLLEKLRISKEDAFQFRRRRHPDWTDIYTLYRGKVQLNRLTQRQSVHVPLLKSTVKTLLKDVDDPPILYFKALDNDEQKEVYYNSYWDANAKENQLILKDVVDKRQVMLFGRSFKFLNICNGKFEWEIVDPQDVLVDRYVDPSNIDTARVLIRQHIYVPLSSLEASGKYNISAIKRLQAFFATKQGLIKAEENALDWVDKQRRLAALGDIYAYHPKLGETYVELNEFSIKEYNRNTKQDEITFVTTAEDMEVLCAEPLCEVIGETRDDFWKTHFAVTTWGDETERTDFWSDGVCDSIVTINKIMDARLSQKVENGTLRNFGMQYFNSSLMEEGFTPQTFEAVPWGWYPIPVPDGGKIGDQVMRVDIPDLKENFEEMQFLKVMAQEASAATTFQQGVQQQEGKQITLGEVQLLVGNAKERIKSMAVYYNNSWEDFGIKYIKMLEAASDLLDPVEVNRKGRTTKKNYTKLISPEMWYNKYGYKVEVQMKEDMEAKAADSLQKLQYTRSLMPTNVALDGIIKKKSLEFADLSAAEMSEVMKEDEQQRLAMMANPMAGMGQPGMAQPGGAQVGGQPGIMAPTAPMAA